MSVRVSLNGQPCEVAAPTLEGLLLETGHALAAAMACAVNGEFVPRARWAACLLHDGDRIDVIAPVTGG
ncbi:MAG: sulfur carrier protein ThiS [Rhizobacter sp.]|jgi:sulfur carrier protein